MARILMLGAFGQRNVGDEALCAALCSGLEGHDVVIASADPDRTATQHGAPSIAARPAAVLRALGRVDAVLVAGGTIFKPLHPASGRRPIALLVNTVGVTAAARWRGIPIGLVGVGAAELRSGAARRTARRIASRADLVVLRDEESASVLTAAGARPPFWIGADLAWNTFHDGRPERPRRREGGRPRATVALSHLAGGVDPDGIADRLGGALAPLVERGWQVDLQPWQHGGADVAVAERIRRTVPSARVLSPPNDLADAAERFAADDLVIAMRFHALVAAGAAGTPTMALAHEPKLVGLARRLDQIAVPPDASVPVLTSAIDWARRHDPPAAAAVAGEIELARRTTMLARLLVEGGRLDRPEELLSLGTSDGDGRW